jgi:hypothetical protein
MALISRILRNGTDGRLIWWCPGCDMAHTIQTGQGNGPRWGWNGNVEKPTFTPSVLVTWGIYADPNWKPEPDDGPDVSGRCHSFVIDGRMQFLGDCTHALANQTVDIPDWPRPNWSDG